MKPLLRRMERGARNERRPPSGNHRLRGGERGRPQRLPKPWRGTTRQQFSRLLTPLKSNELEFQNRGLLCISFHVIPVDDLGGRSFDRKLQKLLGWGDVWHVDTLLPPQVQTRKFRERPKNAGLLGRDFQQD